MEFLDLYLTKNSSLLLYAIRSPFYWRILKASLVLKILTIKVCETRNLESIHELHYVERENDDRKPDKNREDASLCLETSTKNVLQEFHDCFGWRNKMVGRSNSSHSIQRPEKDDNLQT